MAACSALVALLLASLEMSLPSKGLAHKLERPLGLPRKLSIELHQLSIPASGPQHEGGASPDKYVMDAVDTLVLKRVPVCR